MDFHYFFRNQWDSGQILTYSGIDGKTDFHNGLTARSTGNSPAIEIVQPGKCQIRFPGTDWQNILLTSDFFQFNISTGKVQGAFLDAYHLLIEGICEITSPTSGLRIVTDDGKTLIGSNKYFDPEKQSVNLDTVITERQAWLRQLNFPTNIPDESKQAVCKALSIMKSQVYTPEGIIQHRWTTPDRYPHRGMWLWDSVFHAIGWRHIDLPLARDMIDAVLDTQREDGFIAHASTPISTSQITQPPILCLGVKLIQEMNQQSQWLESIYPKLCAYIEWDLNNRDTNSSGLLEWFIEEDVNCRSGESGMDNSPRFDRAIQLDAVDFNAFISLECEILAEFAKALNLEDDFIKWDNRHTQINHHINLRLWSEEKNFFFDYDHLRNTQSDVIANAGFLPLICGAATQEQADKLANHLQNPQTFATPLKVATIAANDEDHYAKDMWRGPVWVNINWLIALGFERYGFHELSHNIRMQTLREIERYYRLYGTFFEFYDDRQAVPPPELLRKGKCAPEISLYHQVFHDYGWTATLYVDMLLDHPV